MWQVFLVCVYPDRLIRPESGSGCSPVPRLSPASGRQPGSGPSAHAPTPAGGQALVSSSPGLLVSLRSVRPEPVCLSCVIIPSQLPPVATGPGAPWPQSSVQPRPRSCSHHTSGQQHQGGGHHHGQPPGGDNPARAHREHRRGLP